MSEIKPHIHVGTVMLMRYKVTAAVLYLLTCAQAWSSIPLDRKWSIFEANMTEVYGGNLTEISTPDITVCAVIASRNPPANLACHKSSRCVIASVNLPRVEGRQTDGFTCWYSQVCIFEEALVRENENVTTLDPLCPGNYTFTCSKEGMIEQGVRPRLTTCSDPFTQHSFGCMFLDRNFKGTYCEARKHCKDLGANLASPETPEDCANMTDYYDPLYAGTGPYYVGLYRVNVSSVWRWPANQREPGPRGTGDCWGPGQPDGGNAYKTTVYFPAGYKIADEPMGNRVGAVCHVWGLK